MAEKHELQLMLVNTLRKSHEIPRICLALDYLISRPDPDAVPAYVFFVILHAQIFGARHRPHVRRRVPLAYRALSCAEAEIMTDITDDIPKLLKDKNSSVVSAALSVSIDQEAFPRVQQNCQFDAEYCQGFAHKDVNDAIVNTSLTCLALDPAKIPIVVSIIQAAVQGGRGALVLEAFTLLSTVDADSMHTHAKTVVDAIRPLLTSRRPNDLHLFLSCLLSLDVRLWSGTHPDFPAVLDAWEVEKVMQLLDSPDRFIRRQTLALLNAVDPNIVSSFFEQAMEAWSLDMPPQVRDIRTDMLLDIIAVQAAEGGEQYGSNVISLLQKILPRTRDDVVYDSVVTRVLTRIQAGNESFRLSSATTMVMPLVESNNLGSTTLVISAALATEYVGRMAIAPPDILIRMSSKMMERSPSVQDTLILAMLRVAADCDEVPESVSRNVGNLAANARHHIKRRCQQFTSLSNNKSVLAQIVAHARSRSLPDFLEALEAWENRTLVAPESVLDTVTPSSDHHGTVPLSDRPAARLRYDAYEAPQFQIRLRDRSLSSSPSIGPYGRDTGTSSRQSHNSSTSQFINAVSDTITPGQLALVGGKGFAAMNTPAQAAAKEHAEEVDDLTSGVDLIAFDSPAASQIPPFDFEVYWNSLGGSDSARGWYDGSIETVASSMQGLDGRVEAIPLEHKPFVGELKLTIWKKDVPATASALLRLGRHDDGCLWRLRCSDAKQRLEIKRLLAQD
ncbi:hypothetical protein FISHEDRAFT_78632 [Fistulina hepatica ATCC 64428]|uniref:ARM repeat-containing protein n=1 Tax=Fistulina hepatica ATCC 64428 TaxID=1128425 RepID=A0A0D7A0C3_9AGAR|nr:hypothetical protein FISHEDRAFT_78632 [Fistulina hepatica ATCC 64428]